MKTKFYTPINAQTPVNKTMPFLKELNPMQNEATTFDKGPLLILAGAGSGKTRVLTTRIAYLVLKRGISPERILAVTFTNKAAGEMRERLAQLMGEEAKKLWLGTFHSLGLRILRREGHLLGLGPELTVYNDEDQLALVKDSMSGVSMSEKAFSPRAVLSRITQAKNDNVGPEDYLARSGDFLSERVASVYSLYQKRLKEMGALDFGDLICEPIRLFKTHPHLLRAYSDRFLHILVDEYQDTNGSQYMLMNLLASSHRNICAVGDPDQSIYAWRGADLTNILEFERDWPDATVLRLEQNYRSTKTILSAANSVINNNKKRIEKTLWTDNHKGQLVRFEETRDEHHEAGLVGERLKELLNEVPSLSYRDFAVFYRTNAQSRVFEERFLREGIPYTIVGGFRFYDRREIRDALAYLRIVTNPADSLSLKRIINTPPRRIGKNTFENVSALSKELNMTLFKAFREAISRGMLKKSGAEALFEAFDSFKAESRRAMDRTVPLHELALRLLEDSGYMGMWVEEGTEEALERVENLHELISAIRDFEKASESTPSISDFLDQVSLITDIDTYEDKANRVTIMTLHAAKGLEFPVVFIVGMEDGLFPHSRSTGTRDELEEERRLCYVGMTRAMERLFLHSARTRTLFGELRFQTRSRFIEEIDPAFLERVELESQKPYDKDEKEVYIDRERSLTEPYYTMDESQLDPFTDDPWRIGLKVRHPSFGLGVIKQREGVGEETKLTVKFKEAGHKKIIVKYASLVPVL
jgi:DNA helicase-2/ATP-dependent DNA helicase PcrA